MRYDTRRYGASVLKLRAREIADYRHCRCYARITIRERKFLAPQSLRAFARAAFLLWSQHSRYVPLVRMKLLGCDSYHASADTRPSAHTPDPSAPTLLLTCGCSYAATHRFMPLPGHANDSVIDAAFRSSTAWAEMTRTNTVNIRSDILATQNTSCSSYPQILPGNYPGKHVFISPSQLSESCR